MVIHGFFLAPSPLPPSVRKCETVIAATPESGPKALAMLSTTPPSTSSSALRSATTASVSPVTRSLREKNSASPSSEPSIRSNRLRNEPAIRACECGALSRRQALSAGASGLRFQHQHKRKIGRIDDEGFLRVRPEAREHIGLGFRNLGADESENRLQERKRHEAKQRKRPGRIR